MRPHKITVESTESSSPIVTRGVAAGLMGTYSDTFHFPAWQRWGLEILGRFPENAARWLIPRFQTQTTISPSSLVSISIDSLIDARLRDYLGLTGRFPSVTVGAALGGASAHLALALGGPFLPQSFVTTLKGGSQNGEASTYFNRTAALARETASNNPGILTIQHYDPIHDGWLTRHMNHLRFKLIDLPQPYADFLRNRLEPGGAVCYLDCCAQWLRFKVGERSYFQVGGWGGIPAQEFLEGSPRIQRYCRAAGLSRCDWRLPDYPLETGPESEWGSEPGLGEALERFCKQEGYHFIRVTLPKPHDFSRLAFYSFQRLLEKEGLEPGGVLVEMFTQFDASSARRGNLLPLWLVFNTLDSLAFLREMIPAFPADKPVFFSPLATFSLTPDLVPWQDWEAVLEGLDWRNIGTRPSHYPADALALTHWSDPLRDWVSRQGRSIRSRLSAEELLGLARDKIHALSW